MVDDPHHAWFRLLLLEQCFELWDVFNIQVLSPTQDDRLRPAVYWWGLKNETPYSNTISCRFEDVDRVFDELLVDATAEGNRLKYMPAAEAEYNRQKSLPHIGLRLTRIHLALAVAAKMHSGILIDNGFTNREAEIFAETEDRRFGSARTLATMADAIMGNRLVEHKTAPKPKAKPDRKALIQLSKRQRRSRRK